MALNELKTSSAKVLEVASSIGSLSDEDFGSLEDSDSRISLASSVEDSDYDISDDLSTTLS